MDKRYKRLGKNTFIVFVGNAGSRLIGLLMLPYYTSHLSTAAYGASDIISTYASILLSLVTCCIADGIFIFPHDANQEERTKYFSSGLLFTLSSFFIWALVAFCLHKCFSGFISENAWWIYGLTLSQFLQIYIQQFTRSIDKMTIYSVTGIVQFASIAGFAFLFLPNYGLSGYLWSLILANIVAALFSFLMSGAKQYFSFSSISKSHLMDLLKYGIPLIPNTIMWWLINGINRPIMEVNLGLDAVGVYAVASKIPAILSMLFIIFSNAWTITMLEEFGKPDFNLFFNRTVKLLFFVMSIGAVLLIISSKLLISVFASNEFYDAWRYVPVLTIGVLFQSMSGIVGGVFSAEKKSKYFFYSSIWGAASSLIFTIIGVHLLGLMGVSIAVSGSFLCMAIVRIYYAWKHINLFNIKYYVIIMLFVILAASAMVLFDTYIIPVVTSIIAIVSILFINKSELISVKQLFLNRNKI